MISALKGVDALEPVVAVSPFLGIGLELPGTAFGLEIEILGRGPGDLGPTVARRTWAITACE